MSPHKNFKTLTKSGVIGNDYSDTYIQHCTHVDASLLDTHQYSSMCHKENSNDFSSPGFGEMCSSGICNTVSKLSTLSCSTVGTLSSLCVASANPLSKPPNILVFCGDVDNNSKFHHVKSFLKSCLNMEAYTIYHVHLEELLHAPWQGNCSALIIAHHQLPDAVCEVCVKYFLEGGRILSFGSSLEDKFIERRPVRHKLSIIRANIGQFEEDIVGVLGCYAYHGIMDAFKECDLVTLVQDSNDEVVAVKLELKFTDRPSMAVFSQLLLNWGDHLAVNTDLLNNPVVCRDESRVLQYLLSILHLDVSFSPLPAAPTLTPCLLLTQSQALKDSLLKALSEHTKNQITLSRELSLKFVSVHSDRAELEVSDGVLPVIVDSCHMGTTASPGTCLFQPDVYWKHLTSTALGRVVFYTEVISSTMPVFSSVQFTIPDNVGVIAIAGRQSKGKGRGRNDWIGPAGCAMFTLPLRVSCDSQLGGRASFLQHLATLSVVHAVRSMPGFQDLDLRIKWPNDIYYGQSVKLGGVLATSTMISRMIYFTVGVGVNVSNPKPTMSINCMIERHNREHGSLLPLLSTSEVIARSVSVLETLIDQFQSTGQSTICHLYYKYWLHSGVTVKIESEGSREVMITGLDQFGFLSDVVFLSPELVFAPDFKKIVLEVRASGPPHVLRLLLGVHSPLYPISINTAWTSFCLGSLGKMMLGG